MSSYFATVCLTSARFFFKCLKYQFEKEFYKQFDMEVDYVGHPLLDAIIKREAQEGREAALRKALDLSEKDVIAILPGSRKQEISKMLPIMLKQMEYFPNYQFVLAAAPGLDMSFFDQFKTDYPELKIVVNRTYDLLELAKAAMVTSGTATLETALFKVPEVVCYKGNVISYQIAKRLVNIKYISLVNLIMDEEIVRELIQNKLNTKLLKEELGKLLDNDSYRTKMLNNFDSLITKLGAGGASAKTAKLIVNDLSATNSIQ